MPKVFALAESNLDKAISRYGAGRDIVDGYAIWREVGRNGFGHHSDASANRIGNDKISQRFFYAVPSQVDDASPAGGLQCRQCFTNEVNGAHQIEFIGGIPVLIASLFEGSGWQTTGISARQSRPPNAVIASAITRFTSARRETSATE